MKSITQNLAFFFTCLLLLNGQVSFAQNDSLIHRPGQISFITPMGTNGMESGKVVNHFSINILAGYSGGLEGLEIGSLANVIRYDMEGVQMAGFGNTVLGNMKGTQMAGFYNVNRRYSVGAQMAGFVNVVSDSAQLFQASGFVNVISKKASGVQLAGFTNVVNGEYKGFQAAGFTNTTVGNHIGSQISGFANVCVGDITGSQVSGFVNVAKKVKGLQLGFININDTVEKGLAIGFLTISKKGYHSLSIESNESFTGSAMFKIGTDRFYNIFAAGFKPKAGDLYWGYGYGIGTRFDLSPKMKMNVDAIAFHIQRNAWLTDGPNLLNRIHMSVSYPMGKGARVYAGPSFGVMLSYNQFEPLTKFAPWSILTETINNKNIQMYPGFNIGMHF